jgi:uncharacterized membrane protein YfcA
VIAWLQRPESRVRVAVALLVASVVGWPLSALTFARDEPQFILGLSWLAITITAIDVLATTDVRREQESSS